MKTIVAQWCPEDPDAGHRQTKMVTKVVVSDHPHHNAGYVFDLSYLKMVAYDGYSVVILPESSDV